METPNLLANLEEFRCHQGDASVFLRWFNMSFWGFKVDFWICQATAATISLANWLACRISPTVSPTIIAETITEIKRESEIPIEVAGIFPSPEIS
ncbi:hypothetical protein NC653_030103 [Populus alba x Populus x berolinensis]|uniref:Uncharacterized protein n=1 Tax=Populus alba x Populus x berolinensis TaxID=444605 RepID=A0AAD6LVC8_9ROSI|nr:hypothetical protein NC653_030103 [Populus alba x Populus x berolinensis]